MCAGIATVTTSTRAELVGVSPVLEGYTGWTDINIEDALVSRGYQIVWAAVGGIVLSIVIQIMAAKALGEGISWLV